MIENELPPNQQLVREDRWPVVGERGPSLDDRPWRLSVSGCVGEECSFDLGEIQAMPQVERRVDVHCVTRWSKLRMAFSGVPLSRFIYESGDPRWTDEAGFVSFIARSERGHSTSLPLRELLELDALVALRAEGEPLATEHGGPLRMVVPGKYFYKSVKWLERVEFLKSDRLGYWEADAGYHNGADPWREERYISATISKQEAFRLISDRDFSGKDLLSLDASNRDLNGLKADRAALRNASFRGANLSGASFQHANLSNAYLHDANLANADLRYADLEGADFSGANLAGADLTGASLFGATFVSDATDGLVMAAQVSRTTQIQSESLGALTEKQREFMERALSVARGQD